MAKSFGKKIKTEKSKKLTITFWLKYHTNYGENIFLEIQHHSFKHPIALEYFNNDYWKIEIHFSEKDITNENIFYSYFITNNNASTIYEANKDKFFNPSKNKLKLHIIDGWNSMSYAENIFYTKPFQNVFFKQKEIRLQTKTNKKFTHTFKVKAPIVEDGKTICLLGNADTLSIWDTNSPLLLSKKIDENFYSVNVDLSSASFPVEYKYGVYDLNNNCFEYYEKGENRVLNKIENENENIIVHDVFVALPYSKWKAAGIAIPVFSIRTENSFGIGEFLDIKILSNWANTTGIKLLQLLPVNDTTITHTNSDSYPYAAISAFALHPIYLNIEALISSKNKKQLNIYNEEKKQLNSSTFLEYEKVLQQKWKYIHQLFHQQKEKLFSSSLFKIFFQENKHWLMPYAVFCYVRDEHKTADFNTLESYKKFNAKSIEALSEKGSKVYDKIAIHYFVQYYLHQQLQEAVKHAHKNKVAIKGDIPIGVHKFSVDVWQQPHLFNTKLQAGAPPDDFAIKGQNWGFPTYNWSAMKSNNYLWWQQRFAYMSNYFDAFRIDHILGFFRIWNIPIHAVEGIMGYFSPAIPVHKNEFAEKGIWFNYERYTQPFISPEILDEIFDKDKDFVIKHYLIKEEFSENFILKAKFNTQVKIEKTFAHLPNNSFNERIKNGLFDLVSNVILFEVEESDKQQFHFRFNIEKTTSFQHLEKIIQHQLLELYNNYFFTKQNEFWKNKALEKLPVLIKATNMLVCGEDLGLVPSSVAEVMNMLSILSLEVQRMPKDFSKKFFNPTDANYVSVVTPSTHDMSTIRGWWQENKSITQQFYNTILEKNETAPDNCETWISKAIITQHLYSPAMLCIFQLQDLLGMDENVKRKNTDEERINNPANAHHYWCYRMHLTVEHLLQQEKFNAELKKLIQLSGR